MHVRFISNQAVNSTFFGCLEIFLKKFINLAIKGPWGPFFTKDHLKSASQGQLRSPRGCQYRSRMVPWALIVYHNDQKHVPKCLEGLENVLWRKGKNSLKESWKPQGAFLGPSRVQWRTKVAHGPFGGQLLCPHLILIPLEIKLLCYEICILQDFYAS